MGNDPGPLDKGEEVTVILKLTGEVSLTDATAFRTELDQLLDKFRPKMGGLTRPIKRSSGGAEGPKPPGPARAKRKR